PAHGDTVPLVSNGENKFVAPAIQASAHSPAPAKEAHASNGSIEKIGVTDTSGAMVATATNLPPDWPDPRGFTPDGPSPMRPIFCPSDDPVVRHTRIYNGHDAELTAALDSYVYFRDDARFGGWQSYLERSDDFIRFCCHLHISEMLTARGGAGESRVVWRWPASR